MHVLVKFLSVFRFCRDFSAIFCGFVLFYKYEIQIKIRKIIVFRCKSTASRVFAPLFKYFFKKSEALHV